MVSRLHDPMAPYSAILHRDQLRDRKKLSCTRSPSAITYISFIAIKNFASTNSSGSFPTPQGIHAPSMHFHTPPFIRPILQSIFLTFFPTDSLQSHTQLFHPSPCCPTINTWYFLILQITFLMSCTSLLGIISLVD